MIRSFIRRSTLRLLVVGLAVGSLVFAGTVIRMNLGNLCERADRIFRGTVLDIVEGEVEIGGGKLPTRTYVIRVEEAFKGEFPGIKGEPLVELTTLGKIPPRTVGRYEWRSPLPDPLQLAVGASYLLFGTEPSSYGLSTTVGLGQGCFHISGAPGKELATNELNNVGLFSGMQRADLPTEGGLTYERLAAAIRADLGLAGEAR